LECLIVNNSLSPNQCSDAQDLLHSDALRKAWKKFFGECDLFVFSVAVNPLKFLEFLTTHPTRAYAANYLQTRLGTIVERAESMREKLNKEWGILK
jgi:hypothetical protein